MSRTNPYIIGGSVILAVLAVAANMLGQEQNKPTQQSQSERPPRLPASLKGADLYHEYCASCHGVEGKGNGPVASSLTTRPADLTRIAERNGGIFPLERVKKIISGDQTVSAHGSSEMPVWGPVFHQVEKDRDYGHVRLQNLAEYLQTLQTPEPK